ncbi:uracil-DNA glycosylase [Halobacteriovorax marinus]|uniref:Uracil-DNA glycosylase n=1 Tax=Halobacteriovorax marinus (strain ATCC BAA-682 / DSM 15412 / SJ) TaxID=862908 RepID=E1X4E8_HALMS|nr:uracil-DNA glycosylase [Halobacteriovorax marinus]ATH08429.1 uracil-DNA glycosylase [Halobacteriovorax marinus]CBW27120.1 uracil-DNA glycosylase (UDG) [Halobacteriovorax marinus SJ]
MKLTDIPLHSSWKSLLKDEFSKDYFKDLEEFLVNEFENQTIYPPREMIFHALNQTPLEKVRVVLIGQDPYHGEGQAHGLSFSVEKGIKIPPSLRNIYKELNDDLGVEIPEHGDLSKWAQEGVLLLNDVLTVQAKSAGSHQKKGWEKFTDRIIELIDQECENVVFFLWGSSAQKKARKVDTKKHLILKSVHPSPLSSYRGFFGSKPFSKTNHYLKEKRVQEIDWNLK